MAEPLCLLSDFSTYIKSLKWYRVLLINWVSNFHCIRYKVFVLCSLQNRKR